MSAYKDFDALLLKKISEGYNQFSRLQHQQEIFEQSEDLVRGTKREAFRVVDARLQALRKAGKVTFSTKTGWACA